jgi:hypothetical protein
MSAPGQTVAIRAEKDKKSWRETPAEALPAVRLSTAHEASSFLHDQCLTHSPQTTPSLIVPHRMPAPHLRLPYSVRANYTVGQKLRVLNRILGILGGALAGGLIWLIAKVSFGIPGALWPIGAFLWSQLPGVAVGAIAGAVWPWAFGSFLGYLIDWVSDVVGGNFRK